MGPGGSRPGPYESASPDHDHSCFLPLASHGLRSPRGASPRESLQRR
jgi:hypothetical protein